jgi:hypothetical protein
METILCGSATIALLIFWYLLEKTIMTPYDIYRKWKADIIYVAPEEVGVLLAKTSRAITAVEDIFDRCGPNSDAGVEAVEVLQELRKFYADLKMRGPKLQ